MEILFLNLLNLLDSNIYTPLLNAFNNNDIIINFIDFVNSLLVALFGNDSLITIENFTAAITITLLIICLAIIINLVVYIYTMFTSLFSDINLNKKKRGKK